MIQRASTDVNDPVKDHLCSFWTNARVTNELVRSEPIIHALPQFHVTKVHPRTKQEPWVYCTNGCFRVRGGSDVGHEFFVLSPTDDWRNVELLAMLAHFHSDPRFRLALGKIVRIGEPWLDGSCDHLLISLPYPYGPKLEWATYETGRIHFLWVLPITQREAGFAELNGNEALERAFDKAGLNYLDMERPSVI